MMVAPGKGELSRPEITEPVIGYAPAIDWAMEKQGLKERTRLYIIVRGQDLEMLNWVRSCFFITTGCCFRGDETI